MTKTIDKQAAIASLGGPEKARHQIDVNSRQFDHRQVDSFYNARIAGGVERSVVEPIRAEAHKCVDAVCDLALSALEADDGRALLRQLRDDIARRDATNRRNFEAGISPCKDAAILEGCSIANTDVIERIDDLLAAEPAQIAEPAAQVFRDAAKDCTGEMFGERAAVKPASTMLSPVAAPSAGDWPEDAGHENGSYLCKCVVCGVQFIGHKRRCVCNMCSTKPAEPAAQAGDDEARIAEAKARMGAAQTRHDAKESDMRRLLDWADRLCDRYQEAVQDPYACTAYRKLRAAIGEWK